MAASQFPDRRDSASPVSDSDLFDALGRAALRYIKPGQIVGLGTGRAAGAFIRALAEAHLDVRGVPTSQASAELAHSLGIQLVDLRDATKIDIDIDGADEVDPRLNMIKGLGGAMVREKIVATAARKRIFLVGDEKLVKRLGERGKLPIEVVSFSVPFVERELARRGLKPALRRRADGGEFISDNGNHVIDCAITPISNPARLERNLISIAGVVGTGLFIGIADTVLVARRNGKVQVLRRSAQRTIGRER